MIIMQPGLTISLTSRFRPLNSIEKRENSEVVVAFDDNAKTVMLRGEGRDVALAGSEKVHSNHFGFPGLPTYKPLYR